MVIAVDKPPQGQDFGASMRAGAAALRQDDLIHPSQSRFSEQDFLPIDIQQALHKDPEAPQAEAPKQYHPLRKFIREVLPKPAYALSSIWHLIVAGLLKFGGFSKETKDLLTKSATNFTKVVNSLVYSDLAVDAFQNGSSFDFLGRIAEPICSIFVDLNHYHLFRAFSSAFNQLHMTNLKRVTKGASLWKNFLENLQASKEVFMETWNNDITGPKRKLMKGQKDEGHTLAFASHLQLIVGALALLNGNSRNFLNRALGVARNAVGVLADIGLIWEKDPVAKKVGGWYLVHAIGDMFKRFVGNDKQDIVDNLIMPFYNAALYNFGLTTRRQTSGEFIPNVNTDESHKVNLAMAA